MALTITIEGKGVIANCDILTNDTGGTGTGDWSEQGGGTMTLSPDVYLYGSGSIGGKYASKSGFQQFDLGVGNELDFTAGTGTEDGQSIYMWVNMAAFGTLDTLANFGLCIRISSSSPGTTNYVDYRIGDGVDANGWTGGWKLFVIDPTITGSRVSGTQSSIIASVRTVGIWIDTAASVRAESLWIDQIAVGSGLRMVGTYDSGTYGGAWEEAVAYCTDFTNRAWGMLQERDGIYYVFGKMYIGENGQTAVTDFKDSGKVLQFGTSQFYGSGNTWISSYASTGAGIIVEDDASFTTTFEDGIIVGVYNGRSGSTFIGNPDQDVELNLDGGNNIDSVTAFYGTNLKDITGSITSADDVSHKFLGVSFAACEQFDPVGASLIRNCTFAETTSTLGALLYNTDIDIKDCNFIANTLGAAIEVATNVTTFEGTVTTADVLGVTLTDTSGNFVAKASTGDVVYNETDGSFATIISITSSTIVVTDGLTGGTDNQWDNSDAYSYMAAVAFTNLGFSANTIDIDNNSTNLIAIDKSGTTDISTSEGFTVIRSSATIKMTIVDVNGDAIENVQTGVYGTDNREELFNGDTDAGGGISFTYTGSTPREVEVRCRKGSTGATKYKFFSTIQSVSTAGLSLSITLEEDLNNNT